MKKISDQYITHLRCTACQKEWFEIPQGPAAKCPACAEIYIEWLNFDETFGQHLYKELGTWDEVYGKLSGKEIRKLVKRYRKKHR